MTYITAFRHELKKECFIVMVLYDKGHIPSSASSLDAAHKQPLNFHPCNTVLHTVVTCANTVYSNLNDGNGSHAPCENPGTHAIQRSLVTLYLRYKGCRRSADATMEYCMIDISLFCLFLFAVLGDVCIASDR